MNLVPYIVLPFERYNGILYLEGQHTNNRCIEMQLIRRFQNDNLNFNSIKKQDNEWPDAEFFLLSPVVLDMSVSPRSKSVIEHSLDAVYMLFVHIHKVLKY